MSLSSTIFRVLPASLLAGLLAGSAAAATYTVDASHSRVGFSVSHMTVSKVRGEFGTMSGTVEWDAKNVAATKVDAKVGVASVDTRDAKRDEHLRGADFFDAVPFPEMTFKSKSVKDISATSFSLVGDLTIRGVTKEVTLKVNTISPDIKDPWGGVKAGTSATTVINRKDWGLTYNATLDSGGLVIGDEVTIELDIELAKK